MYFLFATQFIFIKFLKSVFKIIYIIYPTITNQTSGYPNFVLKFEKRFAKYINKKYCLTFSNGTSALKSAIFSIGLKQNDVILVPNFTFHSTVDPILNLGHKVRFVSCDRNNLTICTKDLKNKITNEVKCLIIVHPFGFVCDMDEIIKLCKKNKIYLIEDCSHCHGALYNNKRTGSFGNISIFSLQKNKSISAGEGGVALTNSKKLYLRMSLYSHFNRHQKEFYDENYKKFAELGWGEKARINPLGISLANVDLKFINYQNTIKYYVYKKLKSQIVKSDKIFLIEEIRYSSPGGFFTGIPLIFIDKETFIKFQNHDLNHSLYVRNPWVNLEGMINYDSSIRKFIRENIKISNIKVSNKNISDDHYILIIPFRKFGNTNYKKIVKEINSFISIL